MRRLQLKSISFEKQMTVVLPCCIAILFVFGVAMVHRRQAEDIVDENGEGYSRTLQQAEPVSILCVLQEEERMFCSLVRVSLPDTVTAEPLTNVETVYHRDGVLAAKAAVGADYYVDMRFDDLRRLLQYCGDGVQVYLEESVYYTDHKGLSVLFPEGNRRLSANQAVYLLRASDEGNGGWIADMCADLVVRYGFQTEKAYDRYAALTECADTDIRIYDFAKYLPLPLTEKISQ